MDWKPNTLNLGQTFKLRLVEDLKRTQIVQYAGASGDYNPLHTDEIYATQVAGYPSVFAHGMLTMGMTGQALAERFGAANLTGFGARFTAQVWPGDTLDAAVTVTAIRDEDGARVAEVDISTTNQHGSEVLRGYARARID